MKKIIHHNHLGFIPGMQGWLDIYRPINVIWNRSTVQIKTKESAEAGKALDKFNIPLG